MPKDSLHHFYCASLASKIHGLLKASSILFQSNFVMEAKILTRSVLECLFRLAALSEDTGNLAAEILMSNDAENLRRIKLIQDREGRQEHAVRSCEGRIKDWASKGIKLRELSNYTLAELAGLTALYRTHYLFYSWNAHGDGVELEQFIAKDKDGKVAGIILEPIQNNIENEAARLCLLSSVALKCFCKIFKISDEQAIKLQTTADHLLDGK